MKVERFRLENGIPVILVPTEFSELISTSVVIDTGARNEGPSEYGISHYIEHTVFKGTRSYPDSTKVMDALEPYGAIVNAWTSEQATCYYNPVPKEHWERSLSVLSELVSCPLFDEKELEKEKGPVIEEIKRMHDDPLSYVYNQILEVMWPGQPIGNGVLGPEKNIRNFKRQAVLDYFKKNYIRENMLICVVGAISKDEARGKLENHFGEIPSGIKISPTKIKHDQKSTRTDLTKRDIKQGHIALGYKLPGRNDLDFYALIVLNVILGGGMSSLLFREIREKRGLAYAVMSEIDFFSDAGILVIYAGLKADKVEEALGAIKEIQKSLAKNALTEKRVKQAKEYIRGMTLAQLDGVSKIGYWIANKAFSGEEKSDPNSFIKMIGAVTSEDIQKAAKRTFSSENESLVVLGPFSDEKKFAKILAE